ncbi:MAG: alanine-glyoxylate transaminase / serine-glyoxylate transaminase / serine-pyruvate transaminase [Saliniramus fredricksonii]|uniref:Alanine-glyoxylate transaminase / serine-glyoxylate transaminase / serine-pyruvate transaminase n=1 Tax=Saliniramus fredricksonii TaxID=1653334 RepID=A0A0N8KDR2_9HYPH|nr:aminotransferase class V-fold PLP-dependent enzyme [Saliniramus fredricksonii]KPQ09250.1 MAG: alanine-glyoxylate transaminase / serine-glyoxylate transaminase / serine-pyruvate transaminase [Saliniramus fredricksonii]SCC82087.1 alanine-glyoxylate transaminase / serine-glyoxylate transaminase / serine-pyruvate transaminase [Saliniramus fredricksonii]
MTVANGRELLSIPGPTTVPDRVLSAMHRPAIDIYAGDLLATTDDCLAGLKRIFGTSTGHCYIYAANGHGAWEAALTNVLSRGDKVLVLQSGRFAMGWGEMGGLLGLDVEVLEQSWRRPVDPQAVEARLRADTAHAIKAVLVVQIDTASGVANDIAAIRKAIDAAGHPALYMVDTIASLGTVPFSMDDWGIDVALSGSQKGLMTPPGLSFVAHNQRAFDVHARADLRTRYWDWTERHGPQHYQKYCGTPPEHMLFGLREALAMLFEEGLDAVWRRHRLLAEATRAAVGVWSRGGALDFNIEVPQARADSVTCVLMGDGYMPEPILEYCKTHCGVVVGVGIGELSGKALRLAHMGHTNAPMVLGMLGAVEMALQALDVPHERGGVQAAIDHLAGAVKA